MDWLTLHFVHILQLFIHLYVSMCNVIVSKDGLEISYQISHSNVSCQTDEHRITFLVGLPLSDCVLECGLRKKCLALTYHHGTQGCLLLSALDDQDVQRSKCDVIHRHDMNISQIPCVDECTQGMTCDREENICKVKECPMPSVFQGNVLGNDVSVGSRLQYKCDPVWKDITGIYQATCSEEGTWSYVVDCSCIRAGSGYDTKEYIQPTVYTIELSTGARMNMSCDITLDSNGWIVIQRRVNDSDFYKTWEEYKTGFGDLNGNFWLGNENIRNLVTDGSWKLRVDLMYGAEQGYAEYDHFAIGDEASNYMLTIGGYSGNIGDSLFIHNGAPFSTKDRDNDIKDTLSCAQNYLGAWWYTACHNSNLNGMYGNNEHGKGLNWKTWKGQSVSNTRTEMKIQKTTPVV